MTDQTSAEIVRRLRNEATSIFRHPDIDGLCARAASLIEALSAEKAGDEPVAWLYEVYVNEHYWSQRYSDTKPQGNQWQRNIRPLYLRALAAESTVARLTGEKNDPVGGSPVRGERSPEGAK